MAPLRPLHVPRARALAGLAVVAVLVTAAPALADATPTPTPTPSPSGTASPSPSPSPTGTPTPSPSASPTPPPPATPANLPTAIEPLQPYVPQDSCDPTAKPGVQKLIQLLNATYPDSGNLGIATACIPGDVSEHHEGRAVDWAVSVNNAHQVADVNSFFAWLLATDGNGNQAAMARRLGIMYLIWNRHILGTYRLSEGWRPYNGADPHTNHVHISLSWAGAWGRTSYWTGTVAPVDYGPCRADGLAYAPQSDGTANTSPCPAAAGLAPTPAGAPSYYSALRSWSGVTLRTGSTGAAVKAVQQALGITADGGFGSQTAQAVSDFQQQHQLPATGVVDNATWQALLADAAAQAQPSPSPTPSPSPSGSPSPSPSPSGTPAATVPGRVLWSHPKPPRFSRKSTTAPLPPPVRGTAAALKPYTGTTLKSGSSGAAVKALQTALGIAADGAFGPQTKGAVVAFQTSHGLSGTGVVDASTWAALVTAATLDPYRAQRLQVGSTGTAVKVLQQALGVAVDGQFGPQTRSAVQERQVRGGLTPSGVVDAATWRLLGA